MTTITVEVNESTAEALAKAANLRRTSIPELLVDAADWFAEEVREDYDAWSTEDVAAIEEGMAQLRRGEGIPHERVIAQIRAKFGK